MELDENYANSLLSDDDVIVDEEIDDEEIVESNPLEISDSETGASYASNFSSSNNSDEKKDSFISEYLKDYGITDSRKIQFTDDSGNIEEVDFDSLSEEEKLNMIRDLRNSEYSPYERQVIDFLRQNNASLEDVINYYKQAAVEEYRNANPQQAPQRTYTIDEYTDDEIYLADLKSKYPDFSDEELLDRLDSAKSNIDLFDKEVEAIRNNYIAEEEAEAARQQEAINRSYQELENNIQNTLSNFREIVLDPEDPKSDALQIEDGDREIMLRYLLEQDSNGKSQLVKDLEDPQALIELAYYRTRERDNLTGLTRYWKNELATVRKEKAQLQKELDKLKNKGSNSFVVTPNKKSGSGTKEKPLSVLDIYG